MKEDINSEDLGQELIDAGFGIDVESMEIEQLTSDDTLIKTSGLLQFLSSIS